MSYWLTQQPLQLQQATLLEVTPGSHPRRVLQQLRQLELIQGDERWLYYSYRLWQRRTGVQAGLYQLQPGQSLTDLWRQLAAGEQHLLQVTLVEGQTLAQWLTRLAQAPYLTASIANWSQPELLQAVTGRDDYPSLEGLLMADTYSYQAYSLDLQLLRQAYGKLQQQLQQAWQQRADDLPYQTPYELLIMASIIEKETGLIAERPLIASVFVNRLRSGMRLQSDPTTIYGIEQFDGNLTRAHLRTLTPYNTYRIDGLPPTPIAMVSRASLQAAAQPAQSDYYYFVADGSGGHVFSKTYHEHQAAVNRYQRKQP